MVVISPDAATRHGRRWVVLPLSTVSDLASNPLAHHLAPTATNGLRRSAAGPAWPAHIFCKASNRGSLTLKPEAPLAAAQRQKPTASSRDPTANSQS